MPGGLVDRRRTAGCRRLRRVWLHDGSPATDVRRRDVIGWASEPARNTYGGVSLNESETP